jgi:eukaryotic-like serine/threonine-protein kinase
MPDIFLSYSREDQATARRYAQAFEREGFGVWWDVALNPGETFDKVTEQALRDARAVVVLWSRHSVDSRWVRSEATQADRYGTLVPVTIEACDRPILFELSHTADLTGWNGDSADARWRTLVDGVRRLVGKGGAPTPFAPTNTGESARSPAPRSAPRIPYKLLGWIIGAIAVIGGTVTQLPWRDQPSEPAGQLMRFTVSFQDNVRYSVGEDFVRSASISPDGKRMVFTGSDQVTGEARIYIRKIDSEQATPLPGGLEGTEPFWSPDSKSVGFYAGGKVKIAGIESGQVRELANAPATGGASWNDQGQILISLQNPGPLVLIPAAGGTPKPVTLLEPGDLDHDWPQFLDDGVHFLYMVGGRTAASNKVFLASLASPERTLLLEGIPAFAYASPDRIIYLKDGVLVTQVLDVKRAALVGEAVVLAENALPPFSASRTGAMTYRTIPSRPTPLIWIKPDGSVIGDATAPGFFVDPQISPDGKQIAVGTRDSPKGNYDVAILDIETRAMRKLTVNPANDRDPVWSPDGKSIVYLSTRPDAPGLYRKNSDGTGAEELVLPSKGTVWVYQWTRGRLSFFDGLSGALDIGFLSGPDLRARTMAVETPFNDVDGAVSPDGRWLAYTSNGTGRWEMYLTSLETPGTTLPITSEGGCDPTWSRDGTTLYYTRTATSELMAMPVKRGNPPTFGTPRRIHPGPLEYASAHSVDIDPRGDRLIIAPGYAVQGDLTVLVNWQSAKAQ